MWRNQDQNSNQGTHEMEILLNVKAVALEMLKDSPDSKVPVRDLIARTERRNPSIICPKASRT